MRFLGSDSHRTRPVAAWWPGGLPRSGAQDRPRPPGPSGRLRALAALAGLGVIAWLVWETGGAALLGRLRELSWRLPLLVLPQACVVLVDAAGWRYAFPGRLPRLTTLLGIRLAGEAVNDTTPTGTLGGEGVKAWLLAARGVPLEEALVSVVVAKTALAASQVGFLVLGLVLLVREPRAAPALLSALAALVLIGAPAVGGFVWAQQHGLFRAGSRLCSWIGLGDQAVAGALRLDTDLRAYYRNCRGRLALTLALHFLGWVAGGLEVWLALRFLHSPVPFTRAIVIEGVATGVRSAGFLVPASIGIQEGGLVGGFAALGLGAGTGLAFGVIRRVREAVWAAAGYGILLGWCTQRKPATT